MEGTGTKFIDSHIYFIKLKTHIIGAYGQYNKLKPYYTSNGWKFKVSDLIKYDGTNAGPGCFFSLKQADILLPLMEKDGWDIKEVTALVDEMKRHAENLWKQKEEEKRKQDEASEKWKSTIQFQYLTKDEFAVYGNETKIIETLNAVALPKRRESLAVLGKQVDGCYFCHVISYRSLFTFLDNLGGSWDISNTREWALGYSWKIENPEQEPSKNINTLQDMDAFFAWCDKNQTKLYAGTIEKKYRELIGDWRFKHFIKKLTRFFSQAKDIDLSCREWYELHKSSFEKDMDAGKPRNPRAKIIYTPMGGQNKK